MGCKLLTSRRLRWLVFMVVDIIRHRAAQHDAVVATGVITAVFVLISGLSAFPWVRKLVLGNAAFSLYEADLV